VREEKEEEKGGLGLEEDEEEMSKLFWAYLPRPKHLSKLQIFTLKYDEISKLSFTIHFPS
jgi:hypothetical protein